MSWRSAPAADHDLARGLRHLSANRRIRGAGCRWSRSPVATTSAEVESRRVRYGDPRWTRKLDWVGIRNCAST